MDSLPEFIISIHVPTWGTTIILFVPAFTNVFQFTFPRGERPKINFQVTIETLFQFTFPRGERLHGWEKAVCTKYFNSRSHVGNDKKAKGEKLDKWISIHVPTWGTTGTLHPVLPMRDFNSRSHVGNDPSNIMFPTSGINFNSRSHVGNDG